ncbi:MAG TPA: GSCFA domain-containing protein [Sphingomonas sp.]|uniref:GSCFA domain-containing protein n=1 Tax=Sphingomonas sp. TaxID=28214 RepID=UPI002CBF2009|nr:GSCFA domain-containing protein [Sphingomonas sp.]HMI20276.1 GSCFA domain-containing protein [Sphingomonas sp.]
MADHPYRSLPDSAYWRRSVAAKGVSVDPLVGDFPRIGRSDKVATAGSCFAQHVARHLAASGFNYLVTEQAHPIVDPEAARAAGYGLYTARYGNIYTTLQLVQLVDRAYGRFTPAEDIWISPDGKGVVDPFRPTVQPGGFASEAEMRADRAQHLSAVREALETLDIIVFTLGLTESWVSKTDGAAFPLCPGVAGGAFDSNIHTFRNLRTADVRAQIGSFVDRLRAVNPKARLILTVSPVPLAATASGNHVLPATIYSKSALRAAAQEAAEDLDGVFYFPSYEIVTGPQARGRFFAEDLREVTEEGVEHVMRVFLRHAAGVEAVGAAQPAPPAEDGFTADMARWVETMCDEAMLDGEDA